MCCSNACYRVLDALGVRQQGLTELGQSIPARLALHQRLPDAPFEFDQPPLHGRLVDTQRTTGRQRAAVSRDGQQMLEIVPVEAVRAMRHCGPILQFCALRREAPGPKLTT